MTKTPHKHAEAIRAWANGDEIEFRAPDTTAWVWSPAPAWVEDYEYRVKPARSYPETTMSDADICNLWKRSPNEGGTAKIVSHVMNAAIRHALDAGQVVTREEFTAAIGDRDERDWYVAEEVIKACINVLGAHWGQHHHSQNVLRGVNLTPIIERLKK